MYKETEPTMKEACKRMMFPSATFSTVSIFSACFCTQKSIGSFAQNHALEFLKTLVLATHVRLIRVPEQNY